MLFQQLRPSKHLQVSLRAAIASHRPAALKIMFDHHGEAVFANALAGLSKRAVADALSMLPAPDRHRVQSHLPKPLRYSVAEASSLRPSCISTGLGAPHALASNTGAMPCAAAVNL